jgi:hypothetical protein
MPFFLVYGAETILTLEIAKGSPCVVAYDEGAQDQLCHGDVILLKERRQCSTVHVAKYHQALSCYH